MSAGFASSSLPGLGDQVARQINASALAPIWEPKGRWCRTPGQSRLRCSDTAYQPFVDISLDTLTLQLHREWAPGQQTRSQPRIYKQQVRCSIPVSPPRSQSPSDIYLPIPLFDYTQAMRLQ